MNVKYAPEILQAAEASRMLGQASTLLADILGPQSSQLVTAEWSCVYDHRGRLLYRLSIRDFTGEVSTDFAPDDLKNALHMRFRLARLWGDLLQVRNKQQHEQVQALSALVAAS